eukprot:480926-Pleurochrysis_carterae.AAC.3
MPSQQQQGRHPPVRLSNGGREIIKWQRHQQAPSRQMGCGIVLVQQPLSLSSNVKPPMPRVATAWI